jgi:hypothetical protein
LVCAPEGTVSNGDTLHKAPFVQADSECGGKLVEMVISLLHPNFDVTDKSIIDNAATMILGKCF